MLHESKQMDEDGYVVNSYIVRPAVLSPRQSYDARDDLDMFKEEWLNISELLTDPDCVAFCRAVE